ncbi:DUF1302 domain-containing protein [Pokkaliibacter plantistimulans]|uniref:DUF1302 domain-containing protein n=1 Tax=Proteobacteria bacterium 228 TaxID=2083153 RepID=A0A2S5KQB4_9PROT|nr:DUF1302 domain-containing protein [Pokkaliibacter plantistimulans]PPC76845.1 DUF1302 domain-containing protein [Pokkaliibacter plantistimulans]
MTTKIKRVQRFTRRPLSAAISGLIGLLAASQAHSFEFNIGEIQGRLDSNISVGASWRLEDADPYLISKANGGTGPGAGNDDDGNLNFHKGETFSKILKGVHDLDLRYQNLGAFVRGKYWYDMELEDGNRSHGNIGNGYTANTPLSDDGFDNYSKFSGAALLDAFVYGNFDLGTHPLDVRLGRQVVSWGESTFLQGGVNTINPVDANTFRRPGAEVKEGLLPVNMLYGNLGVTDNLSMEAFYQLEFEHTVADGCGTMFSDNDYAAAGCNGIRVYSSNSALSALPGYSTLLADDSAYFSSGQFVVQRDHDGVREASDDGQFGVAFRYLAEQLNSTEFGMYFTNLHSRLPVVSAVKTATDPSSTDLSAVLQAATGGISSQAQLQATISALASAGASNPSSPLFSTYSSLLSVATLHTLDAAADSTYFTSYPENIQTLGLSFNTTVGEVALSGEYSYKHDVPMQINGSALLASIATLGGAGINAGIDQRVSSADYGDVIRGYDLFDVSQVQLTAIKTIDRVLGADQLALVGEVGFIHVHGLDDSASAIKYGRSSAYGYTPGDNEGFVTPNSWGYAMRASLSYPDAVAGINLTPSLSFKHDVDGVSPQPGGTFNEGAKSLGLAVSADYLNKYYGTLSWNRFYGGDYNTLKDRDYASMSFGMSF